VGFGVVVVVVVVVGGLVVVVGAAVVVGGGDFVVGGADVDGVVVGACVVVEAVVDAVVFAGTFLGAEVVVAGGVFCGRIWLLDAFCFSCWLQLHGAFPDGGIPPMFTLMLIVKPGNSKLPLFTPGVPEVLMLMVG